MKQMLIILCLIPAADPYTVIVKNQAKHAAREIALMMRDDEKLEKLKHQRCEYLLGEMRREMTNNSHPQTVRDLALQVGTRALMDWAEYQSHPQWRKRGRQADK